MQKKKMQVLYATFTNHIILVSDNKDLLYFVGGPRIVYLNLVSCTAFIKKSKLYLTVLSCSFFTHVPFFGFDCLVLSFYLIVINHEMLDLKMISI